MGLLSLIRQPSTIRVEFVNADTQAVFGVARTAPQRLPASFAGPVEMEFGGRQWCVVVAEPISAPEYLRTGRLRLHVRPSEACRQPLFTLPTYCDICPPTMTGTLAERDDAVLPEDDWRQIEFVAMAPEKAIR